MFLDISADDIRNANVRKTYVDGHHNRHNPIAIAAERIYRGCTAYVTPTAIHLDGPQMPSRIVALSKPAKAFLAKFDRGQALPVQRLMVT